ncbi:hypothetical protein J5837_01735 [Pseudoxanthomonas helianthi]|uniref:Uncharacterized protein n=1 Tax=Pseudoxanthomonas helianthi TaxID=1453541 RepID=A0A941ARR8_9GAMM|nr:hypothetical protein [Pseudoxanthomonas helianthi]MBP3983131.1 hypothetical protein [Pseudoxanthomonas helianthi]
MHFLKTHAWTFALASLAALAIYFFEGHAGLNLWDEGYLWYGSQRVVLGEMPMRDFYAYDPARYYITAAVMRGLHSDGIIAVRIASYAFQALGIWTLLIALKRDHTHISQWNTLLVLILVLLWMFPRHKLFDVSTTIMVVAALAAWIRQPDSRRTLLLGAMVGLAACMGRNHGLYAAVAAALALLVVPQAPISQKWKSFAVLAVGGTLGYSPMLLAMAFSPGFASSFFESIRMLFEIGATNLPISVPWPWLVRIDSGPGVLLRDVAIGLNFVFLLAFPLLALVYLWKSRQGLRPHASITIAAVLVALPYAHFAISRADVSHLAQGAIPAIIAAATWNWPSRKSTWAVGAVLLLNALVVMLPMHPGWQARKESWKEIRIVGGEQLVLPPSTAMEIGALQKTVEHYAGSSNPFVATPYWPGAYALMRRKSPMWEIYSLVPHGPTFQLAEIQRIRSAHPALILLQDYEIDGMPQRRLAANQPLLYQYLVTEYASLPADPSLPSVRILIPPATQTAD